MPSLSSRNEAAAVMLRLRWIAKPGPFWDRKRPFSRSAPNFGKGSNPVRSALESRVRRPEIALRGRSGHDEANRRDRRF